MAQTTFSEVVRRFAQLVASEMLPDIMGAIDEAGKLPSNRSNSDSNPDNGRRGARRAHSSAKGRKLDMHCRVPGCSNPSKGPRFGFMCDKHVSLPKKEQDKLRAEYKEKHRRKAA